MEIQKTDLTKSPLLVNVINRDYTKGLGGSSMSQPAPTPTPAPEVKTGPTPGPGAQPNFQKPTMDGPAPGDTTKEFSFNEDTGSPSDLGEGETGPGVTIPTGSARTFANTIGNLVQIYLPRATYGYVKIDIENVRMNVERGILAFPWIEHFTEMNKSAEEGLKIPDESIKMWKAALQHYLEYKQVAIANPETEFWIATGVLLIDEGIRTVSIKKQLETYMAQALKDSNPDNVIKQPTKQNQTIVNEEEDEHKRAA